MVYVSTPMSIQSAFDEAGMRFLDNDSGGGIPAALIGRLARDERIRGEEIGNLLLADAVRRVIGTSHSLAVFAIVDEATDEKAAAFYCDFGFPPFPNHLLRLFMPASEAAEAISRALFR